MTYHLRLALILVALLLPAATLLVLGGVWLWQNGLMLYWALAACLAALTIYGFELWMLRPERNSLRPGRAKQGFGAKPTAAGSTLLGANDDIFRQGDRGWTPAEQQAWQDVLEIADQIDTQSLTDRQAFLDLGRRTVEAVALSLHPADKDPLLRFTLPEALALVERVAGRLRPFIVETIPLGDKMTVGQFVRIYQWRSVAGYAGQAYDLWRIIRLMNPATAATQEMRERVTKELYARGRDALARQFSRRFIAEVGRAAIDLYGGRLRLSPEELAVSVTKASSKDKETLAKRANEPVRILIAGQTGSGKSSVINALSDEVQAATDVLPVTREVTPYAIERDGLHAALFLDTPGVTSEADNFRTIVQASLDCDLVLWVIAANRADRQADQEAIRAIKEQFAARPNRRPPAMLVVMTKIDALRPFGEWDPPYDLSDDSNAKAKTIVCAMNAVAEELGVELDYVIPVSVASIGDSYNIETLWSVIFELLPEAQSVRLLRCLREAGDGRSWTQLASQLRAAGRAISRNIIG